MRPLLLVLAVLLGVARADAAPTAAHRAITKLVKANVAAIAADDRAAFTATLRPDAVTMLPVGQGEMDTLAEQFYARRVRDVTHKLGPLTLAVDAPKHVAWFYGEVRGRFRIDYDPKPGPWHPLTLRVTGIAIDDGGWKLAAVYYAPVYPEPPDAEPASATPTAPVVADPTARQLGGAITTGTLAAAMAAGPAVAFGETTSAVGLGAAPAATLVTAWSTQSLAVTTLASTQWKGFPIAFVRGEVRRPAPGGFQRLGIGAIVLAEGPTLRWAVVGLTPST